MKGTGEERISTREQWSKDASKGKGRRRKRAREGRIAGVRVEKMK